jgi:hypothetical protein
MPPKVVLKEFAELEPNFPELFSLGVSNLGRTRPYVARTKKDVYPGKPQLKKYAKRFVPGWFVGTNESNEMKQTLLRVACKVLGLRFGEDLKVRM